MPLKITSASQVASLNKWADSVDLRLAQHLGTLQKHNQRFVQVSSAQPLFQTNGVTNTVQNKLNVVAGSGVTITSDASGNSTFNSLASGTTLDYFIGPGLTNLLPYYGGSIGNSTVSTTINQITAWKFSLFSTITVSRVSWNVGTAIAASSVNVGIYDSTLSNKLVDVSLSAATATIVNASITPVTLTPAVYYLAQSSSATGVQVTGATLPTIALVNLLNGNTVRVGQASNATVGGVMPASLGTLTADSIFLNVPLPLFE